MLWDDVVRGESGLDGRCGGISRRCYPGLSMIQSGLHALLEFAMKALLTLSVQTRGKR